MGQGVQERVRGGIVRLTCDAERAGERGEQDERRQIHSRGEAVQMPGRVGLGEKNGRQLIRPEFGHRRDVEHTGGVDHGGEGMPVGHGGQEFGQGLRVGGVAGGDGDVRAEPGEFAVEFGGAGGIGPRAAGQQEVTGTVGGGEVAGDRGAERSGPAGDQYRSVGVQPGVVMAGGAVAGQARHQYPAIANDALRFAGGDGSRYGRC